MVGEGKKTGKLWLRVDDELDQVVRALAAAERRPIQNMTRELLIRGAQHSLRGQRQRIPGQIRALLSKTVQGF